MRSLLLIVLLAACGGSSSSQSSSMPSPAPESTPEPEPPGTAAIANPASTYCGKVGGTLVFREETGGTAGYCQKAGHECEEWKLFRGECPEIAPAAPEAGSQPAAP